MQRYKIINLKIPHIWQNLRLGIVCLPIAIVEAIAPTGTQVLAQTTCPEQVEPPIEQMLPDLPSYANRAIARSRQRGNPDPPSSIIVAGQPEFTPLPLGTARSTLGTENSEETEEENVRQVFFTTLERVYTPTDAIELQGYHWLFLTPTQNGWQLVVMYSAFDSYPASDAPTPPEDTTDGALAQGVRNWLRDCQARNMEQQSRV